MATPRFLLILLLVLLAPSSAGSDFPTPVGIWLHANKLIQVEIVPCADRLCGGIAWFKWPNDAKGLPLVDLKNPDPALCKRPLLGLTILQGLRRTGERTWEDGEIYNPVNGRDYQATMSVKSYNTLRVRAYRLIPMFGETQIWTRVQ